MFVSSLFKIIKVMIVLLCSRELNGIVNAFDSMLVLNASTSMNVLTVMHMYLTIDNQQNGLETQAKVSMLLTQHP